MEPVRLEILLDDKTLKGMRSVEGNLGDMGKYTQAVIAQLESQLKDLQNQFKQAMASGTNSDAQMADIQALTGVIEQLKAELKELEAQKKKTSSTPILGDDPGAADVLLGYLQQHPHVYRCTGIGTKGIRSSDCRRKESHSCMETGTLFPVLLADGNGCGNYADCRIRKGDREFY